MINAIKEQTNRLLRNSSRIGYDEVEDVYSNSSNGKDYGFYNDQYKISSTKSRVSRIWKIAGIVSVVVFFVFVRNSSRSQAMEKSCRFCDQAPPTLHHDKSYTILLSNENGNEGSTVVTPMTISYDYELRDGELLFTTSRQELIPNLGYDYALLGIGSLRNLYRDSRENVSLDEVYVHHFTIFPINMLGAEVLNRDNENDPYMRLPEGYAMHITDDENPFLRTNAHLISNKNLAPVQGSQERAHKECNECYYAPTKGSDCTPELSGTFLCCGDSPACTASGEGCFCPTTSNPSTTTKYTIELDILVSKDIHKFQRIDQWNFAAPSCSVNLRGDSILEDYPPDSYCAKENLLSFTKKRNICKPQMSTGHAVLSTGGGALFHQVYENNQEPYLRTSVNILAPTGGKLVWAQSHLHTGGINATLYQNGVPICSTTAQHGTNDDASTNARNERNHLVRISSCYDQISSSGIRFEEGDVFTTETYYYAGTDDDRFLNAVAAGEHRNAMSMFFTGVVFDGTSKFLTEARTSFNEWNDFVHVAGMHRNHGNH